MKWEEAQVFNEAICFAVFLDSCTPSRNAPLGALNARFHNIWNRHIEGQSMLSIPSFGAYTPQVYDPLLQCCASA